MYWSCLEVLKTSEKSYWKYKIHEFYSGTNPKSTNLRIYELVIFNQTKKVDTHEEKYFHSRRRKSFLFYLSPEFGTKKFQLYRGG
jgi:hypothetical protein